METVGTNVKKFRTSKGWTQLELSKKSGVSRSYISEIESDGYEMSVLILCSLCKALNVTPNDLIPKKMY